MATSKRPERLVVDANPILSALLGGKARRLFFEASIHELAVPECVVEEVRRYLPHVARKVGAERRFVEYALDLLPLTSYPEASYHQALPEARRRIGKRDPADVDVLALALRLGIPLWSNDRDFQGTGVQLLTTARLLSIFFGSSPP